MLRRPLMPKGTETAPNAPGAPGAPKAARAAPEAPAAGGGARGRRPRWWRGWRRAPRQAPDWRRARRPEGTPAKSKAAARRCSEVRPLAGGEGARRSNGREWRGGGAIFEVAPEGEGLRGGLEEAWPRRRLREGGRVGAQAGGSRGCLLRSPGPEAKGRWRGQGARRCW